jgi:hypothetical protein
VIGFAVWEQVTRSKNHPRAPWTIVPQGMTLFMSYVPERASTLEILHLSVNMRKNELDWETFKAIRYGFFPDDIDVIQVFPKRSAYVNQHPFVWHLWEFPGNWEVDEI